MTKTAGAGAADQRELSRQSRAGAVHRTVQQRRHDLRLLVMRGEANRLEREREGLQRQLAKVVRTPGSRGWAEPEAIELSKKIQQLSSAWESKIEAIRAELTAQMQKEAQ